MRIETIDPTHDSAWEEFLQREPAATVFHSTAWAQVLHETYHFTPSYLVARNGNSIVGGIPLFQVNGGRLVGLPFSDACAPLLGDRDAAAALLRAARDLVGSGHASALEVRGDAAVDLGPFGFQRAAPFYQHTIPLDGAIDELEGRWHQSARRAVRKARRAGVTVRASTAIEEMAHFYRLHSLTRKKHGLIPQPWSFLEQIHRHLIGADGGCLLLAEHGGEVVAADVLLRYKDALFYKFNASDPSYLELRPNNLLLREAIVTGLSLGCRIFDLGRCDADAEGLRRFKLLWGSTESALHYYHYPSLPAHGSVPAAESLRRRALAAFVRYAPLWALRQAGAALYRNFA